MSFFKDILTTIKKPIDALKEFLTPKEHKAMKFEVGEGLNPEERVRAKATIKKPSIKKQAYVPELKYAPYKSPTKEMMAQLAGLGERKSSIIESGKKIGKSIGEFGKTVLRAGPRATASAQLDVQGRTKLIPTTKAEKFLFGKEPVESMTERIEKFPQRAKEFGIPKSTATKMAPLAIVGLTALDIIPPLPGKSGLKSLTKKALKTKTAKEFAKAITKKQTHKILKAGFKSVDDFFKVAKNPTAKASTKIVNELKAITQTPLASKQAKDLGYKVSVSNKGFTAKNFKYRLQKGKDLMYANTQDEIVELIKPSIKARTSAIQELKSMTKIKELEVFEGLEGLTLKTVEKLKGKSTVSKQFISDLSNAPDLKQGERDLIRKVLSQTSGDKVNVKEFADRIKNELLPLKTLGAGKFEQAGFNRYESITLPAEFRGNVANYKEVIYKSPIKTQAGKIHFREAGVPDYFAHVRVEDMANVSKVKPEKAKFITETLGVTQGRELARKQLIGAGAYSDKTRRIIEIQSDLFQKGRLEQELGSPNTLNDSILDFINRETRFAKRETEKVAEDTIQRFQLDGTDRMSVEKWLNVGDQLTIVTSKENIPKYTKVLEKILEKLPENPRIREIQQLQPYRNIWHERIIKEEIKRAAKDGKTKLQFPTGETAMKIEGLGRADIFNIFIQGQTKPVRMTAQNMQVGGEFVSSVTETADKWIITNILDRGRFKAVPKSTIESLKQGRVGKGIKEFEQIKGSDTQEIIKMLDESMKETFDISGKIDTSNPIYQFYEKDVQKFLKRIIPDMKQVIDPQGVSWFEINIDKALAKMPVEAFGAVAGIEVDEQGKVSFSPEKAGLGVAGMFGLGKVGKTGPVQSLKSLTKGKSSKIQEIIAEYQKHINTAPVKESAAPLAQKFSNIYTAVIDRFNPIAKLAKKAGKLLPSEDPKILARRYLGIQGIAESKLFWNTTKLNKQGNLEVTGKGLSKILKPIKNNIDDLRTLMVAQRDIELAKRVLATGEKVVGTKQKQSKQVLNALKNKYGVRGFSKLVKTSQEVRDWAQKTLLDPLLEVGALSKDKYQTIVKSNKFYVPFQRVMDELETKGFVPKKANLFTPKSVPIKRLKGSTRQIIDPFESLITNTYKVTDFVERARVAKSITNLRKLSPELAELIKPIKTKIVPVAKQGDELIFRPSFFTPDKNTMMVFENGKRKVYQVPGDVFKAVSGMMEADVGAIMKMLAYPAKLLRAGATLTPEFMGRNPIRDQFTAFVFSKYGYVPGVDLVKGIWNTVGKTDLHGKWLASGGAHSMLVSLDRVTSQATLKKVLGSKDIKGLVKNPVEALRILSEFGEKGTRVGAFGRALKKGVSDLEAGFESRDLTLDFARRGSQTRAVNMLVAFWNAQVQGLNKLTRAFRDKPMQTTFKAVSGITLPSVLLYLHNRNDPRYQELPQWQKDLFWVLPVGDDGPIIRIPKPFEVGIIFGTVPEHILTWIDKQDTKALKTVAKTLLEASAPGYIPTALQPIIENVSNYSFFKQRSIVSKSAERLPKELQANRYTSQTAKKIGELVKYSPAKIDNLVSGYTAGLGKYAIEASDKLLKKLGIVSPPPAPAKTAVDIPFLKAFLAREPIGSGSQSVNQFYEYYNKANQVKSAVTALAEKGQPEQAVNYLKQHPQGFYIKGLNKVARTFSDLRQKRDAVLDSRDINPKQKKKALDALDKIMTEIARQTMELVKTSSQAFLENF